MDENVFEETALEELPREIANMTSEQIELKKVRIQARMELERNRMELEKARIEQETRLREVDLAKSGRGGSHDSFEVTKQARLVPKFEETNVDEYFAHFERTALNLGWSRECWSLLLQSVLTGKAQRAYPTLPTENCADYELVKAAVLKSFELVPEAYRQIFRTQRKTDNQSSVEFLQDKENALEKWCDSKRIGWDVEKLRQLILAEEFLNCVPEEVRVLLSERKTDVSYEDIYAPSHIPLSKPMGIVPCTPITIGITINFMFHNFLVLWQGLSTCLSLFSFFFFLIFNLWSTDTVESSFWLILFFLLSKSSFLARIRRSVRILKSQCITFPTHLYLVL